MKRKAKIARGIDDHAFLDSIIENIPDMIFVKSAKDLRFVRFNRAGEKLLGYSRKQLIGKNDYDFFPKKEADFFTAKDRSVLRSRKLLDIPEEEIKTKNGRRFLHTKKIPIRDAQGKPQFLLGISEDITRLKDAEIELKQRDRQLFESQKLESLGRLAGGVAHEFNNILTGIVGLSKLIGGDPSTAKADSEEIISQCGRAAQLVSQLLAFSRQRPAVKTKLDLNAILTGMSKMLHATIGRRPDLKIDLSSQLPLIEADASAIEQIMLNLCLNARDAVTEGGSIDITTSYLSLNKTLKGSYTQIPAGRYVRLSVADTGKGIKEEDRAHIFEIFFTTKPPGRGSGLGLSVVYGLVQQNLGIIDFSSKVGKGTVFHIYWPVAA